MPGVLSSIFLGLLHDYQGEPWAMLKHMSAAEELCSLLSTSAGGGVANPHCMGVSAATATTKSAGCACHSLP